MIAGWSRPGGFRRDLIVTVFIQSLVLLLAALFILLVSRWLGARGKGLQSLLVAGGQIGAVLLGLGFNASIPSVLGPDPRRAPAVLRNQVWVLGVAATVLVALAIANGAFHLLPGLVGYEMSLGILTLGTIGQTAFAAILLALGRTWHFNLSGLVVAAISLGVLFGERLAGLVNVETAIAAQAAGTLGGALYALLVMRADKATFEPKGAMVNLRSQGRIAGLGYASTLFAFLMFRGDIFLVSSLGGQLRGAGIYSVAVFAAEMALKIPQWAATLLTPAVAADSRNAGVRTVRLFWFSVVISMILFFGFLAMRRVAEGSVRELLGPSFEGLPAVMLAVFPRVIFQAGGSVLGGNLAGKGYTLWHPAATLAGMLGVFGLDILLVPRYGAVGGGLASSLGYLAALAVIFVGFLKHNGLCFGSFLRQTRAVASFLTDGRRGGGYD
jgi:O-antigen/teichoic acid export membrane protein